MNEPNGCNTRREKHIDMHDAIQSIASITQHLDTLIERIQGSPQEMETVSEEKEVTPTFLVVLSSGPDAIRGKTDAAHKRIEQLMELLF